MQRLGLAANQTRDYGVPDQRLQCEDLLSCGRSHGRLATARGLPHRGHSLALHRATAHYPAPGLSVGPIVAQFKGVGKRHSGNRRDKGAGGLGRA